MKLECLTLKNFRGYCDETEIHFDDLTAFIGRNDAGKSSVLEALEIFFNNSLITCEREDLSIQAPRDGDKDIEIGCVFSELPDSIVIDKTNETSLKDEHLLNSEGKLEIKKVFKATTAKPKEKVYIRCMHPSADEVADLLELKNTELKKRASDLKVAKDKYKSSTNASIRQAIKKHIPNLKLADVDLLVDKEDTKKVYGSIKRVLPIYALFQSDRQSRDDDKEVADPMKVAVQDALKKLECQLDYIKEKVKEEALATADRTLLKLREMAPDLASELTPEFKADPKFDSQFKLLIKCEDDIPVNKRGSGVRRLILLNFFRAEAERRCNAEDASEVIYAFEEPETSQHPDNQEILMRAFLELANAPGSQIVLTTHTPALAGLLPLKSLRFIERESNGHIRKIESGTKEVYEKVADTLGVLPDPIDKNASAILLVEGQSDFKFINHTAKMLEDGKFLDATFEDRRFAIVPIGGCNNIKYWRTLQLAEQFGLEYCILLDSDRGAHAINKDSEEQIKRLQAQGKKAYLTRKREPENYIHPDCLDFSLDSKFSLSDTADVKKKIATEKKISPSKVLETYWLKMTCEQIREVEEYVDEKTGKPRFEFTEMFQDFLKLADENK